MNARRLVAQATLNLAPAASPPLNVAADAQRSSSPSLSIVPNIGLSPRVMYVATSKNDGGIERYSVEMAAQMSQRGVPVTFACFPGEIVDTRCRNTGVPTVPFAPRNSGDLRAAIYLAQLIVKERIKIVHVHSRRDFVPTLLGVGIARRRLRPTGLRPRLLLHAHMLRPLGELPRLSRGFFQSGADMVLAVSTSVREKLLRAHGFPSEFVRLLHNGIDVEVFDSLWTSAAQANRRALRCAWGLPPQALVVGMVGRLDAKGQAALLASAPGLLAQFPSLYFVFVGAEGEPGERDLLRALAAGALPDRLILTGPREDIPATLPAFDVLAHLPRDESFGLALAEAMASGLPTVATDIGGCREVVRQGVTGLLTPPGDREAVTDALSSLLSNAELRHRFGAAGRRIVEQEFSLSRQMDRLSGIYEELCPGPSQS